MKYEIELPDEVDRRLAQKALVTGEDVVTLIRVAVNHFVAEEAAPLANGAWSEEGESRRRLLIDKDIAGTLTVDEMVELGRLDQLANEHFDRVAPPPIDGARRLHDRLLKRANSH